MAKKPKGKVRSAVTGRYVKRARAKTDPDRTVTEHDKPRRGGKKPRRGAKELTKWAKTFPDEFYSQMFRLRGWSYVPWSVKRPSAVGKYTNDLIYERLAPGIIDELRKLNPTDQRGRRKVQHHRWLTEDIGHPHLREHLAAVIALMKASSTWDAFRRAINRALPRYGSTIELPLTEPEE